MTDRRIREGVVFWDAHAAVLEEISQRTGVPSAVIVAIIGVETFYGRITGSYRVIDALSTLAFDYPRRSPFFTQELEQFLILAWESGKDPLALKGSYAGAMGYGQFMPSSYRAYARSFEPGGVPDIWDNPADAISSVGHYLNAHGWQAGERVLLDAVANQPPDSLFAAGLKPSQSIETLARSALRRLRDSATGWDCRIFM
jgi:membrane-bound lytic murein transglycosylase B